MNTGKLKCFFGYHKAGHSHTIHGILFGPHQISRCQRCYKPIYKMKGDKWRVNTLAAQRETV
jgi:hypothetical protein